MVRTLLSNAGDLGSIPGHGKKILHATWCSQRINNKQIKPFFKKDHLKKPGIHSLAVLEARSPKARRQQKDVGASSPLLASGDPDAP